MPTIRHVPKGLCRACLQRLPPGKALYHPECRPVNKYRARDQGSVGGSRILSKKEQRRHSELLLMERNGSIKKLRTQVRFPLCVNGIPVANYTADFVYVQEGHLVVEDAKGFRTPYYRLKARLFAAVMEFAISEV